MNHWKLLERPLLAAFFIVLSKRGFWIFVWFAIQTFLPYRSFEKSAQCLDVKRLGKQRVEVLQILNTLAGKSGAWQNHPAVLMWKGYESALIDYGVAVCNEWLDRGYKDTCLTKIEAYRKQFKRNTALPPWLGKRKFHQSHQSNLLRKDFVHYSKYFAVSPDLPYVWPSKSEAAQAAA